MKRLDEKLSDVAQRKVRNTEKLKVIAGAVEEMGELQQALMKQVRGCGDTDNDILELAHVEIMVAQLKLLYGTDKYNRVLEREIDRLNKRIEEGNNDNR